MAKQTNSLNLIYLALGFFGVLLFPFIFGLIFAPTMYIPWKYYQFAGYTIIAILFLRKTYIQSDDKRQEDFEGKFKEAMHSPKTMSFVNGLSIAYLLLVFLFALAMSFAIKVALEG